MALPTKLNLKIYQGSTFQQTIRWESPSLSYKTITGITKAAPCVITSALHGIPAGWRFKVRNVAGMKEINTDDYLTASDTDTNTITVSGLNTLGYTAYTSGGVLEFNTPEDLSGCSARMQIRAKLTSDVIIDELTSQNNEIIIDNIAKTIVINIDAVTTAAYTFSTAVYSLEIVKGLVVTPLVFGSITLNKEITR